MAEFNQFGSVGPSRSADTKVCIHFEAMLTDAVDGTLGAEDQTAFDLHMLGCAACSEMLADAKRGAAWLEMLRGQTPEPPAAMLERIFAQTSGAGTIQTIEAGGSAATGFAGGGAAGLTEQVRGAGAASNVLPFRTRVAQRFNLKAAGHTLLQPRLAMTAAMAFFSIALTLNLTGVRLSDLRASDLKPSSLKRSMYEANAHVVRYYTNLRVVYELESRVHDLQRSSDDDLPVTPPADGSKTKDGTRDGGAGKGVNGSPADGGKGQEQDKQPKRRANPGTSRREPIREDPRVLARWGGLERRSAPVSEARLDTPRVDLHQQERGTV